MGAAPRSVAALKRSRTAVTETPDHDDRYSSRRLFVRLWRGYLRRHIPTMSVAVALMVVEGSTLGLLSYIIQPLFDRVFVGGERAMMGWIGAMILGLFFLRATTLVISKTLLTRVAQLTTTAMQTDLLRHMLTLDKDFYQANSPGALMERVQGDTKAIQDVWQTVITGVGRDIVSLVALFSVAVMIDPFWTAAALIGAPALFLPVLIVQRYVRRKTAHMRAQAGLRSTRLDEVFHGIMPIKLNRMEEYQVGRFERIVDRIVRAQVRMALGKASIPAMIDIITGIGFFAVLMIGGRDIIAGDRTVGEFMSFFTAMALAFQPLRRLGAMAGTWQVAAASLERIYRLFDTLPTITSPARPAAPSEDTEIRLEDVQFAYGDLPVLRGVSFTAKPGETTALVGASGAGKTTVFHLLTRLVEPQGGRITLGGVDIATLSLPDLRARFSVVTQDATLFDETIRENVLLGARDIDEAELAAALDAAHVSPFLSAMPEGLRTPAGPRGSSLSGGQRQRVAIARALVHRAPILLLDEATSALDAESEKLVQEALERLSQDRTTLVIAHRLATVRDADRIVVLDQGRVVEEGTHSQLVARGGHYARLCKLQFETG